MPEVECEVGSLWIPSRKFAGSFSVYGLPEFSPLRAARNIKVIQLFLSLLEVRESWHIFVRPISNFHSETHRISKLKSPQDLQLSSLSYQHLAAHAGETPALVFYTKTPTNSIIELILAAKWREAKTLSGSMLPESVPSPFNNLMHCYETYLECWFQAKLSYYIFKVEIWWHKTS